MQLLTATIGESGMNLGPLPPRQIAVARPATLEVARMSTQGIAG